MRSKAAVAAGAAIALCGTFMPWLRSGTVDRSSYDLIDLVERLGFSPDGPVGVAMRAWPVVPLLLVMSIVALWSALRVPAPVSLALWATVACYVGGTALAVLTAPDVALFAVRYGVWVTLAGALVLAAGAVAVAVVWLRSVRATRGDRSARA